ncbi:Exonuclease V, chloroplastic [Heracleum sosnowskyi]|uniref:Exonuclease V, chloroplastic n=1 Tax=Heracleum sosnowskyi TaxID=360622 RepID=A0AAD8GZ83_9APIA|nr:Exonuclease V, chloroplastic [Heracleum sosnowskyi]
METQRSKTNVESPESPTHSSPNTSNTPTPPLQTQIISTPPDIPIEIVSEEEMALIESALTLATTRFSTQLHKNARSIHSISVLSKRGCIISDMEDYGGKNKNKQQQKRFKVNESLLYRFRRKRGLFVTDITASEWCEKQTELNFRHGKPTASKAMQAGKARHEVLEKEVIRRVKVQIETDEDVWALKVLNFIRGVNQLLFDGLTRELPIIGFAHGVWMVGVIDEIRMPLEGTERNLTLVETKTRSQAGFPRDPQRRNGRLQLMCYKYLWDNLITDRFPYKQFLNFFSLNPNHILCEDIRENTAKSGFPAQTLNELLRYHQTTCSMLPLAHEQMLLRYESQRDHSLIGEDLFEFDSDWVRSQIKCSLEFWQGERDATYISDDERWKCNYCPHASKCPINTKSEDDTLSIEKK